MTFILKPEHLPHYTLADYERWEGRWELISGIPYAMSPSPTREHQKVMFRIEQALDNALASLPCCRSAHDLDWRVNHDTVVAPDVSLNCDSTDFDNDFITVPPLAIFEVLSPSTAMKDLNAKKDLYASQAVAYYAVVHPVEHTVQFFVYNDGKYHEQPPADQLTINTPCGELTLNVKDFWG